MIKKLLGWLLMFIVAYFGLAFIDCGIRLIITDSNEVSPVAFLVTGGLMYLGLAFKFIILPLNSSIEQRRSAEHLQEEVSEIYTPSFAEDTNFKPMFKCCQTYQRGINNAQITTYRLQRI